MLKSRKTWFILFMLALFAVILPATAEVSGVWSYRVDEEGMAHLTGYLGDASAVAVPESLDGVPVCGLDRDTFPEGGPAKTVTVPVAVYDLSDGCIGSGIRVKARHGAPALSYAEAHGLKRSDLSRLNFNPVIVDLTGSDYTASSGGYSLSLPLGRLLQDGRGIYIPEAGSAFQIDELTRNGGRYLADVTALDPIHTYDELIIRVAPNAASRNGVVLGEDGIATVTYTAGGHVVLRPLQNLAAALGITTYCEIYNREFEIVLDMHHYKAQLGIMLCQYYSLGEMLDDLMTPVVKKISIGCDVDLYFQNGILNYSGHSHGMKPTIEIGYTPGGHTASFDIGNEVMLKLGLGLSLSISSYNSVIAPFEMRAHHIQFTYEDGAFRNESSWGTMDRNSTRILEGSEMNLDLSLSGSMYEVLSLFTVSSGIGMETRISRHEDEFARAIENCADVSWDCFSATSFTLNPGIDLSGGIPTVNPSRYVNMDRKWKLGSWGFNQGMKTQSYISIDLPRSPIPIPMHFGDAWIQSGETKHFEFEDGRYVYKEECTRHRQLIMDSGIEGQTRTYDISDYTRYESLKTECDWLPSDPSNPARTFLGWYDESGARFFHDYIGLIDFTGDVYLTGRWNDQEIPKPGEGNNDADFDGDWINQFWGGNVYHSKTSDPAQSYMTQMPGSMRKHGFTEKAISDWIRKDDHSFGIICDQTQVSNLVINDPIVSVNLAQNPYLKSVIFSNSIEGVGGEACPNLEWVILPGDIKSVGSFGSCYSLHTIELPETVTEITSFASTAIPRMTLPAGVRNIPERAFYNCRSLYEIKIPGTLDSIGFNAFAQCTALESFECRVNSLRDDVWEYTENLGTLHIMSDCLSQTGYSFVRCGAEELIIDAQSTAATNGPQTFSIQSMPRLKNMTLNISNIQNNVVLYDLPVVENIVIRCDSAKNIEIRDCGVKSIVIKCENGMGDLFVKDCPHLRAIECGDTVHSKVSNCPQLNALEVGAITSDSDDAIRYDSLPALETLTIADGTPVLRKHAIVNCTALKVLSLPAEIQIEEGAWNLPIAEVTRRTPTSFSTPGLGAFHTLRFICDGTDLCEPWSVPAGAVLTPFSPVVRLRTFYGWTDQDDRETVVLPAETFTMPDHDVNLIALWANNEYEVLDENGIITYYYAYNGSVYPSMNARGFADESVPDEARFVYISEGISSISSKAFSMASSLQAFEVDPGNSCFRVVDEGLYSVDGTLVAVPRCLSGDNFTVPEGTLRIGDYAFGAVYSYDAKCDLSVVCIPDSVTELGTGWYIGLPDSCYVYGPESGPVADACLAAGLRYNLFPVIYVSDDQVAGICYLNQDEEIPMPTLIQEGRTFLGWGMSADSEPLTEKVTMTYGGAVLYALWDGGRVPDDGTLALTVPGEMKNCTLFLFEPDEEKGLQHNGWLGQLSIAGFDALREKTVGDPVWSLDYDADTGLEILYFDSAENGSCGLVVLSLPDSAGNFPVTVACEWGGQRTETVIPLHFEPLTEVPSVANFPENEVILAVDETWEYTFEMVPAAWTEGRRNRTDFRTDGSVSFESWVTDHTQYAVFHETGTFTVDIGVSSDNVEIHRPVVFRIVPPEALEDGYTLRLPEGLKAAGEEAFAGTGAETVVVNGGCTVIESRAFADSPNLRMLVLPSSVTSIADDILDGCGCFLVVIAPKNSPAWTWATDRGYPVRELGEAPGEGSD